MIRRWTGAALIMSLFPQAAGLAQMPPQPTIQPQPTSENAPDLAAIFKHSYLKPDQLLNSAVLAPPPPAPGSAALRRDEEGALAAVGQRGSARWALAVSDAELFAPDAIGGSFSCAAGFAINARATPILSALLQRAMTDFAISTIAAKRKYQRARPFMTNGEPSCTPEIENMLSKDGSYPSGHSAIGFGVGLILAEIVPSRAADLALRGRVFGDSRRICNVHWLSDIEEGRILAAATLARLHAEPAFQKDMAAARAEADATKAAPTRDCTAEASVIAALR